MGLQVRILNYSVMCIVLCLALLGGALAQVTMVSPIEGASVDPVLSGFQFRIESSAVISSCKLLVDNQTVKEAAYNDVIVGRTLKYAAEVKDGAHTWQIVCESDKGTLASTPRNVVVKNAEETGVTVQGSGIMRGSLEHALTLAETPIVVRKVAQGDVVTVTMYVAPQKFKRELYLRGIQTRNGTKILWMEDLRTGKPTPMYFQQGIEYTLNMSSAKFLLQFVELSGGKAVIRIAPIESKETTSEGNQGVTTPEVPSLDGLPPIDETGTETPAAEPVVAPETPTPGAENAPVVAPEQQTPPATHEEAPKPGFFKRLFGWLSGIFG